MAATATKKAKGDPTEVEFTDAGTVKFWKRSAALVGIQWSCGEFILASAKKLMAAIDAAQEVAKIDKRAVIDLHNRQVFQGAEAEHVDSRRYLFPNYDSEDISLGTKGRDLHVKYYGGSHTAPLAAVKKAIEEAMKGKASKIPAALLDE